MQYFGRRYPNLPIYDEAQEVPTPVGEPCIWCQEPIEDGDDGQLYNTGLVTHVECLLRQVVGGVNHQLGRCSCCGGTEDPDPPGMTAREAARAAARLCFGGQR